MKSGIAEPLSLVVGWGPSASGRGEGLLLLAGLWGEAAGAWQVPLLPQLLPVEIALENSLISGVQPPTTWDWLPVTSSCWVRSAAGLALG